MCDFPSLRHCCGYCFCTCLTPKNAVPLALCKYNRSRWQVGYVRVLCAVENATAATHWTPAPAKT